MPVSRIIAEAARHGAEGLVVGLPLQEDGSDSDWTAEVRTFAARLEERSSLPVFLIDERFSSIEAEARIRSIGLKRRARRDKGRVDAGAAAVFLQDWLDGRDAGAASPRRAENA